MIASPFGFLNLLLMIVTLALVLYGFYEKRVRQRVILHTSIMTAALVLTLVSVLLIMVPSFTSLSTSLITEDWRLELMLLHHLVGLLALAMASLLAFSWLLRGRRPNGCWEAPGTS